MSNSKSEQSDDFMKNAPSGRAMYDAFTDGDYAEKANEYRGLHRGTPAPMRTRVASGLASSFGCGYVGEHRPK